MYSQSIATYYIKNDSSNSHYIKLYSDGTTLEVSDRIIDGNDIERRHRGDKWDLEPGEGDGIIDAHHEEIRGTYKNSLYKQQLKEVVLQNYRNGKLKELPTWL
ncbi:MAG: hypothetical protein WBA07_11620 [Rivularia sp. (in: cyanobacteria)]